MDEWTEWAVAAVPLDDSQVDQWFTALVSAYDETREADAAGWDPLAEAVRGATRAAGFDGGMVDDYLRTLADTGRGVELIERMAAERDALPRAYRDHRAAEAYAAADVATGTEPFAWVTPTQQETMSAAWGDDWAVHLPPQLDYRWGEGWDHNPAEHKAAWLTDVLADLIPAPAASAASAAASPAAASPAAETPATAVSEQQLLSALDSARATVPGAEKLDEADLAQVAALVRDRMRTVGAAS